MYTICAPIILLQGYQPRFQYNTLATLRRYNTARSGVYLVASRIEWGPIFACARAFDNTYIKYIYACL